MGERPANITGAGVVINSHGPSGYNHGCRCEICRSSNASRKRERVNSNKKRPVPEYVEHGASCYVNWGCRCDVCTAAHTEHCRPAVRRYAKTHPEKLAAQKRARNDRTREAAARHGYQWTGPELELAGRPDLSAMQVAKMIDRTESAVRHMRHKLKNDPKIINLAGLSHSGVAPEATASTSTDREFAFTDPVTGRGCTLVIPPDGRIFPEPGKPQIGIRHPDCDRLADVCAELDAFFCPECRWNGRASGAWCLDMIAAAAQ